MGRPGFYERRTRTPSERAVRHAMLTDLITQIRTDCHGIYGARRVHAELTLGSGVQVGHNQVELRLAIITWIERTYHRHRRHARLGRLTPIGYETIRTTPATQAA
jgi:transposase InsO family protein